ncbi:MAG TPA: hypothetical protein VHU19_03630 [Pyrinomonadaceae bacterium]|jgi:ABC-type transporter Mla subunit MlaD|nr:hypothetical protein [Pyrinomonadaceae bacterium]
MTGEEMERAIDFLLKSQANLEQRIEQVNSNLGARIEEVTARVEDAHRLIGELAQTQNEFTQTVTRVFEEQAELNRRQAEFNKRTDERINALVGAVERLISERQNGKGGA